MSEVKYIERDPKDLKPNPWNTNVVSAENELKIEASIKRLGIFKPILVRETLSGHLEILGGEHRAKVAHRLGIKKVPVINLGHISDTKAKEIGLVDNGRYGEDDTLQLSELLKSLGDAESLRDFLPYTDEDINSIFSSSSIALDELELPDDDDDIPELPMESVRPTHQLMRFKVPIGDAAKITELIERVMKTQGYTTEDSLSNAGNALVHVLDGVAGSW
jgi:ParB-like chromosome segregation protein Spo0J